MSRIETILTKSKFVSDGHLVIFVDGVPFDELVDSAAPLGYRLAGSVSSLLGWFHDDDDCKVPWERILPECGCTSYTPILICPDDLDFYCGVVIVEVTAEEDHIRWDRVGIDARQSGAVGTCVRWFSGIGPFRFTRDDYEKCLAAFKTVPSAASP